MSEIYLESLANAIKNLKIADHMIYVTYPVIKDKRLVLKALDNLYESLIGIINSILQYDYLNKRINLSKDSKENFQIFQEKSAKRFNISESELNELSAILSIIERHRKSPMEFTRREKIVIMSDNLTTASIDSDKIKLYLRFAKRLIDKARFVFG